MGCPIHRRGNPQCEQCAGIPAPDSMRPARVEETLTPRQIRGWKNGPPSESTQRRAVKASVRGCAAKRAAARLDEVLGPVDEEES